MSGRADPRGFEEHVHHLSVTAFEGLWGSWQVGEGWPLSGGSHHAPQSKALNAASSPG